MSDPLRPVRPGDPVPFSARTWNGILDAARARRDRGTATGAGVPGTTRDGAGRRLPPDGMPVVLTFDVFDLADWSGLNIDLSIRLEI